MFSCVKEMLISEHRHYGRKDGRTHTHRLYLFDIVACLCTGFNKQNIHLFCSLPSLLCGYLSAMSHKPPHNAHRDTHHTHGHRHKDKGRKEDRLWLYWSGPPSRALSCCDCCLLQSLLGAFSRRQKLWIWTEDNKSKIKWLKRPADLEMHQLFLHLAPSTLPHLHAFTHSRTFRIACLPIAWLRLCLCLTPS